MKRTDPGLPVEPLRFVLKVGPKFDPDDVSFVLIHYSPSKRFFGNQQCDQTYVPIHQRANGLFLPRDVVGSVSHWFGACGKTEALTTEFDDKSLISIKSAMTVCYQPPRIVVQVASAQVKNNGNAVLLFDGVDLGIRPFKESQWGKTISSGQRTYLITPPLVVNPGQTVTLPPVEDGEFLITDDLRPLVLPPSKVAVSVWLWYKRVTEDGKHIEGYQPAYSRTFLGKLSDKTSGF